LNEIKDQEARPSKIDSLMVDKIPFKEFQNDSYKLLVRRPSTANNKNTVTNKEIYNGWIDKRGHPIIVNSLVQNKLYHSKSQNLF
jgi:hypothetical protein